MDASQIGQDLRFVRQVVNRRDLRMPRPRMALYYWAVYVLIGFTLIDFAPRVSSWFFGIGTLVGVIFSGAITRRLFARQGQFDRSVQIRQGIHWVSSMIVIIVVPMILANLYPLSQTLIGQFCCILVGFAYLTAGIHLDRPFFWMGLLLIAGGICIGLVPGYGWTVLGILLSASLFTSASLGSTAHPLGEGICRRGENETTDQTPATPAV